MRRTAVPSTIVVAVLGVLSMAPTAGDIGGCGSEASLLDVPTFALERKELDCERCRECNIGAARCARSCDPKSPTETGLPASCEPFAHDGDVCLRALRAASCTTYATYVADDGPSTPSECAFCKIVPPAPPPALTTGGR